MMFGKDVDQRFLELDNKLKKAFSQIRDEFEDHLTAINENTDEMNSVHSHLNELDLKIEKLGERIDELHMMMSKVASTGNSLALNSNEQKVFLVLYTVEETPLSYSDIARRANLTELQVKANIIALSNKGIPIMERIVDGQPYFRLDKKFKELQAKQNLIKIEESSVKEIKVV